ncbi:FAD-dependent oxidoreductase [Haladaptatus cibarius]|uniref:FAD-dependent oxidoreductase n=1 Tax=Haladaptatus cibarius TaxID=453847 RepID=UPI00067896D6|nr:FAD-dependent oxidoreductase [Haladaptatus cibarius]
MNANDSPETDDLPGTDDSLWLETTESTDFEPLQDDHRVDVAVVGGGIAGLSAAMELKDAGRTVSVLESDRIVSGVTARTTAKLTSQHGIVYQSLVSRFGRDRARQYAEANEAAIEIVAERADDFDCDFRTRPAYTYVSDENDRNKIRQEVNAARSVGLPASFTEDISIPSDAVAAVRFDDQAQFHPRKYLLGLAAEISGDGCDVFEQTKATDLDSGSPCKVTTERGTVTADAVVVATHFPFSDPAGYFARQFPKRSYVLATRIADPQPKGMYYRSGEPYFSVRPHEIDGESFVLIGGQNHKTGQGGSTADRYRAVEREARNHFDVEEVVYRWSTQDYRTTDSVPFVGPLAPWMDDVYVATGFGGWGMTNGIAAGRILADEIAGRGSEWSDVFDPRRLPSLSDAKPLAQENANTGKRFVEDWVRKPHGTRKSHDSLPRGEARVTREDGNAVAEYRDEDGELHRVSAVCTHLKCVVAWNDAEQSWDCPCHGSRFDFDGAVLDGPAVRDLPKK